MKFILNKSPYSPFLNGPYGVVKNIYLDISKDNTLEVEGDIITFTNIQGDKYADSVTGGKFVDSNIDLGEGNNSLQALSVAQNSKFSSGSGSDSIILKGISYTANTLYDSSVDVGGGNNYLIITQPESSGIANPTIANSTIKSGKGNSSITVKGKIQNSSLSFGEGQSSLKLVSHKGANKNSLLENSSVSFGNGDNFLQIEGQVNNSEIVAGSGNDKLTSFLEKDSGGIVNSKISLGSGNNTLQSSLIEKSTLITGNGNDIVEFVSDKGFTPIHSSKILTGAGNDTILALKNKDPDKKLVVSCFDSDIDLGSGANKFISNNGLKNSKIFSNDGDNLIQLYTSEGVVAIGDSSISLGTGKDKITIVGQFGAATAVNSSSIGTGAGNDTLEISGPEKPEKIGDAYVGVIGNSSIDMGDGDDLLILKTPVIPIGCNITGGDGYDILVIDAVLSNTDKFYKAKYFKSGDIVSTDYGTKFSNFEEIKFKNCTIKNNEIIYTSNIDQKLSFAQLEYEASKALENLSGILDKSSLSMDDLGLDFLFNWYKLKYFDNASNGLLSSLNLYNIKGVPGWQELKLEAGDISLIANSAPKAQLLLSQKSISFNGTQFNFSNMFFSEESKKTFDWKNFKIHGSDGVSVESLSTTDLFQYNAANGKAVVDYKQTNFNQFKFGEFSETSYEAINWSKVNFKGITAETYSQMDFSEIITSKGFSAATYKSVDWSKVDYGDFKAETYQKTDWSKVTFGKLSSSSYSAMDWSQVITSTGFKAATYKAVNWGLVDFGDYKAETYQKTDWSKVNFKQFSASSYSSLDWSQVITASGFNAAAYKSVNWGQVDFGDFKQQTFASTKWNQVNFKQLSASQYQAINWNEINLGALSTKTYKAIDWKKVNVAAFDSESIASAKWGLMKGVTKPTAAAKPAEVDLSFLGVTAASGSTGGLIGAAEQSSSSQYPVLVNSAVTPKPFIM